MDARTGEELLKADLQQYMDRARDALIWKLDGLGEYDLRRPLMPTGTNLLGLVKHCAMVDSGYLGGCFGRPFSHPFLPDPESPDYVADDDLWVRADEPTAAIVDLFDRSRAHATATLAELPLSTRGTVPWWGERGRSVTLHRLAMHTFFDLDRHAGQADIVRELIDGAAGLQPGNTNLPEGVDRPAYRAKVEAAARAAAASR
ncbi:MULTISPECIES: DinB family protein [Tsukamurella]|uniref:DinB family protein n=2 Tax=Tsukamurella TaxID=2060 RepID=A0A5C5S514_9ACTN|nr:MULTISPECIES: DinB family protein [Tsukamurella]NMD56659.1 DinB family protein [Tsukamurella columbiensis]TWS30319.1 DinB family protein [Tsukamurella conjunctivitidis]